MHTYPISIHLCICLSSQLFRCTDLDAYVFTTQSYTESFSTVYIYTYIYKYLYDHLAGDKEVGRGEGQ